MLVRATSMLYTAELQRVSFGGKVVPDNDRGPGYSGEVSFNL